MPTYIAPRRHLSLVSKLAILTASLLVVGLVTALPALALTGTVTVKPQVGGVPTRFTFEGIAGESDGVISEVTFKFPEGFDLSKTKAAEPPAEALTLEGIERTPLSAQVSIEGRNLTLRFSPGVKSSYTDSEGKQQPTTLRIYMYSVVTTNEGGEHTLPADYVTDGQTKPIPNLTYSYTSPTRADVISRWLDAQGWVKSINSVTFLSIFVKPQLIVQSIPLLFYGWLYSLGLVAVSFPVAIVLGLMLAFAKMAKIVPVRWLAAAYVNVIRGTPLFLQIAIAFIGLRIAGVRAPDFLTAVIVLALNSSAYLAEIFRAGIQSISKGQFEAASSLGMNYPQSMRYVIIPQTVKRVLPTMTSEFILLFKDTALFSAFGILELMYRANSIVSRTGNLTPFVVAAVYYLLITIPLINYVSGLEQKLAVSEGGQGAKPAGRPKRGVLREAPASSGSDVAGAADEMPSGPRGEG